MARVRGKNIIAWSRAPSVFLFRNMLQMVFYIAVWYGTEQVSATSGFYPQALNDLFGTSLTINEALMVFVFIGGIVLHFAERDLSIPYSRLHIPILLFSVTFIFPFLRMIYTEGGFRIPYEIHNATFYLTYISVFVIFRKEEYKRLFIALLVMAAVKSIEACVGYLMQTNIYSSWGALTEWRDGYLLGMMLISWLAVFAYNHEISRRVMGMVHAGFLVVLVGFIVSIRRSFIVALPVAGLCTILTLRGAARRKAMLGFIALFAIGAVGVLIFSPVRFIHRMEVVGNPMEEFSAAYRLFEYKNVLLNIAASPWFGYPMGMPWKVYTVFPFPVLSPLYAHDTYLNILLRSGFIGLGLFAILILAVARCIYRSLRNARTVFDRICGSSFTGWGVLFIFGSLTAPLLTDFRAAIAVGTIVALIGLCDSALSERVAVRNG